MAVSVTTTVSQYAGNGSTVTAYPTGFPFQDSSWLRVFVTPLNGATVELLMGTDYSVTGAGDEAGGDVLMVAPYPADTLVTIARATPRTQLLDLEYNDRLPAQLVEDALDKLVFMIQELAGTNEPGRLALRFPFAEPIGNATVLPVPYLRRDAVIYFDQLTGEMLILPLDQLAIRLLSILGAEIVLPYRVREIATDYTLTPDDSNVFLRVNAVGPVVITLPATGGDFTESFSMEVTRAGLGSVTFAAAGGGVIIDSMLSATRIFGQYTAVAVRAVGVNRWQIYGDLY